MPIALLILLGLVAVSHAGEPVVTKTDDGVIDWTTRTLRAVGVGTPEIISPTGALTPREPYDVARDDAEKRIARLLARVPADGKRRLRDLDPLDDRREAVAKAFTADESRHFADGTVHLPASADFGWVAAAWPTETPPPAEGEGTPVAVGPPAPGATGLVIELSGPIDPAIRLALSTPAGVGLTAGTAHDPLGPGGTWYARDAADLDFKALVGEAPLITKAAPGAGRGAVKLPDEALVGRRLPGAVVILLPAEGK